ncbi:4'-phosphopantetheinyl transferase superfamily protein [Streptomyces sp. 3MP-14]|uniref:4'-phosphopantetheinyl transferase superfamily protein n=1 Tax=Streptomyces mimosae TaxID=2586635 RepID=A0A5N5ZYN8_9ACTN|nr:MULTISPECIES: 4'-phosphopantetheinyl transferase superfamily protein [Streptomyces]KAB8161591.1 4'-phosphopantetheinyl transferase superfamily protein [Streptomyces mimosae]KAB8173472.1 4'-phosphopantetheinyl transferase superfamily protein [Streptomyces sp. 3MP-14]
MTTHEVVPGVWVASRVDPAPADPHPQDAALAAGMPRWRAEEFLAGRAVLRGLLADVLPEAAGAPVVPGANGKPALHGWPEVGVSIAHDRGAFAAGVAPGHAVGVDVQLPPEPLEDAVLRRCVRRGLAEVRELAEPERAVEFAWIWTAQEACVKAEGSGLSGSPWTIDVPYGHGAGTWRGFRWRLLREESGIPLSCAWKELP